MKLRNLALLVALLPPLLVSACGAPNDDGGGGGDGSGIDDGGLDGGDLGEDPSKLPAPPGCGDGVLTADEACDDGNRDAGDGCFANCLGVEPGYTCPVPGELCRPFARCGDGLVTFPEQCDDGAREPGDGCSANCKLEIGFKCDAATGICTPTTCGDGIIEGAETCDDGNAQPFDGCSADCIAEPNCSQGACSSACGDGIVLGEDCDDGNKLDGDGCSADCRVEAGYTCSQDTTCTRVNDECVLRIPTIFRDFSYSHSDFQPSACQGSVVTPGLVQTTLTNGKPVSTGSAMCISNLGDWYVNKPGTNVPFVSELTLYDDGAGNYANRYGKNGERWVTTVGWACSQEGANCVYDGNPLFYPVDGIPGALDDGGETAAVSTTEYGMDGTTYTEQQLVGSSPKHNFSFTSEITYWFQYDAATSAQLEFLGDDDVWVFINGKLAVDLGGLHQAIKGSVTLDAATAGGLGLEDGKVYEIKVFHAERKSQGSTFKLTLSKFSTGRSDCTSLCGDGIIGFGEECDDGVNDGGYNECQPGCVLGGYCGDGIKQEGETCDDADPNKPPGCSGCRIIVVK